MDLVHRTLISFSFVLSNVWQRRAYKIYISCAAKQQIVPIILTQIESYQRKEICAMTNQTINARNLVTEYLRNIELPADFDLPFLGTGNLENLAGYYLTKITMITCVTSSPQSEMDISENELKQLAQEQDKDFNSIQIILAAAKQAESKPLFATTRPDRWLNDGDKVVCFIQDNGDKALLKKNTFVTGKVVADCKHYEDYVSILANEKVHTSDNQDRHGLSFAIRDPRIMKVRDYNYLKNHPDYLKMWITSYPDLLQFNPEPMLQTFAEQ